MPPHTKPGLILVVDDHETIRDLLGRNLRLQGHRILMASNGRAALTLINQHPVDLVLLDMMMPELNGIEVLEQIKANPATADIPVLILSADSDIDQITSCIQLGAEDYLVKPFNSVFLKARVNSCLEKRRLRARELAYQELLEARVAERTALAEQHAVALQRQTTLLESILTSMGDGVVVIDLDGNLVHHNPAAATILGEQLHNLIPSDRGQLTVFRDANGIDSYLPSELPLTRAIDGQAVDSLELYISPTLAAAGQWLSVTARPLRDPDTAVTGGVAVIRDISAAKSAEIARHASEERYALAAQGANDGLWDWKLHSNQVYFSPRWKTMLGYAEAEIAPQYNEWLSRIHPEDREQFETHLAAHCRRLITHFEQEHRVLHRDGEYRWMLARGMAVWDETGQAVRMAGSQTDITHRKQIEQQLLHDAFYDGLTRLPNRALFLDRLEHALSRQRRHPSVLFAVLFLDLDRFKTINDSLGHVVGDQLLITTARRLEECVRPGDTVARLGGDEFTILLEDVQDVQSVREIAARIQQVLAEPLLLDGKDVVTSTSIGILLSTPGYRAATEMIRDADTAMYHAKLAGKARAALFNPSMHAQAVRQLQLELDLRWAIERKQLLVHYQPIVALDTEQIAGFEALMRWQHPEYGLLLPAQFLSIAEETGLIADISWWVLSQACRQVFHWQQTIPGAADFWVSVNLSSRQLSDPHITKQLRQILSETGLSATSLKLEITEHALIEYGEQMARVLDDLRDVGVQLCIDDFGTGYSSLSYLQHFPVNVLKIDRSFIREIGEGGKRPEIVQTIISLAQTLGMQAVAEGTETRHQADELRRLNCDYGQGWLFSKAVEAADCELLLRTMQPACVSINR